MQFRRCKKNYRYLIHFLSYWEKREKLWELTIRRDKRACIREGNRANQGYIRAKVGWEG